MTDKIEVLDDCLSGWCGAMVAAFSLRARHSTGEDKAQAQADLVVATKLADAMPHIRSLATAANPLREVLDKFPATDKNGPSVLIGYTNWRGEYSEREIVPLAPWYGSTEWHPEPQWLLKAWDVAKGAERDFAIKDIGFKPALESTPAPVSDEVAKPTVEQAMGSLVSALGDMRSQQAKRDEFLATLIVNIEKNEPTAEFAVILREYVRNERAASLTAAMGGK